MITNEKLNKHNINKNESYAEVFESVIVCNARHRIQGVVNKYEFFVYFQLSF